MFGWYLVSGSSLCQFLFEALGYLSDMFSQFCRWKWVFLWAVYNAMFQDSDVSVGTHHFRLVALKASCISFDVQLITHDYRIPLLDNHPLLSWNSGKSCIMVHQGESPEEPNSEVILHANKQANLSKSWAGSIWVEHVETLLEAAWKHWFRTRSANRK